MSSFHVGSVKGKDERSEKEQGDDPGESALSPSLPAFLAESRTWVPSWNNLMVIRRHNTVRQTGEKRNFRAVTLNSAYSTILIGTCYSDWHVLDSRDRHVKLQHIGLSSQ